MDGVERTESLPASSADVWTALTTPDELSAWFGARVIEADVRPGGRLVFRDEEGITRRALVEKVVPNELLTFRWLAVEEGPDGSTWPARSATVEFRLAPTSDGTELTVVETPRELART